MKNNTFIAPENDKAEKKKYVCSKCGEIFDTHTYFYKTSSVLYSGTKYYPICKHCMGRIYSLYVEQYNDKKMAMKRFCMAFDIYYAATAFESCVNDKPDTLIGSYIRQMNLGQYRGKTFDTSLEEGFRFTDELTAVPTRETKKRKSKADSAKPVKVKRDDLEKWGEGFDPSDYRVLNDHYNSLKEANPNCDSNQEIFINDLCYIKMQQMKAIREGKTDDFNKMTKTYRETFSQAGLKTVRGTSSAEDFTFGVNIETIEKYTPAEYYKNKTLYKDFDNIGDYVKRFLLRPLRNLQHGTTERDYEYYIKDEDDEEEVGEFADE